MDHEIISQLKALKHIAPHPTYAARSRATLLASATPRLNPWHSLRWAGALSFALLFLLVATFSLPARPTLSASFNDGVLTDEFETLPINIELRELTYRAATERAVTSAITEIGATDGTHLNAAILFSELSALEPSASSSEIDTLLESVLQ